MPFFVTTAAILAVTFVAFTSSSTQWWPWSNLSIRVSGTGSTCIYKVPSGAELDLIALILLAVAMLAYVWWNKPSSRRLSATLATAAGALALATAGYLDTTWLEQSLLGKLTPVGDGLLGADGCPLLSNKSFAAELAQAQYFRAMTVYGFAVLLLLAIRLVRPREQAYVDARPWSRSHTKLRWIGAAIIALLPAFLVIGLWGSAWSYQKDAGPTSWLPFWGWLTLGAALSLVALVPRRDTRAVGVAFAKLTTGFAFAQWAFVQRVTYEHNHVLQKPNSLMNGSPIFGTDLSEGDLDRLGDARGFYILVMLTCGVIWVASVLTLRILRPAARLVSPAADPGTEVLAPADARANRAAVMLTCGIIWVTSVLRFRLSRPAHRVASTPRGTAAELPLVDQTTEEHPQTRPRTGHRT